MLIKAALGSRFTVTGMAVNISEEFVRVTAGEDTLEDNLSIPQNAGGVVLFARRRRPDLEHMPVGYFGASTGAAAALVAAVERAEVVRAVVSRGGRPDLAGGALARVRAATLLIVGGQDRPVIQMNQAALAQLRTEKRLVIIPGATHLFGEPGALDEVARLAREWFELHLHAETHSAAPRTQQA
jgi:pimeloyl-ACP methyl ester carboxylesterase